MVLSLCGASHQDILQLLIGDVAALSFVPTLLAMGLYAALEKPVFLSWYGDASAHPMAFGDYLVVFAGILLVNIFTMIPFLVHITRGSVMTAKQRLMK